MLYRTLPQTDLSVSLLAFGNFVFGTNWWGEFSDDDAVALQNAAVERGVNFFDTAPAYGNGRSESLMKRTLADVGRDRVVLSTKFGYDFYKDPGEEGSHRERKQDFSPEAVRFELERSLKRMGVEHIDLYQAHNLKLGQMTDELFDELNKLVEEGKLRVWGVALGPAIGWREEGHKSFLERDAATVQTVFNLYEQDPGRELCEIAAADPDRRGVIARVPTNSGILDEEFSDPDHRFPPHDHRKFRDRDWLVYGLKKNDLIRTLAEELGTSVRRLAIRWLASVPGLVAIEPNILCVEDLEDYAAACEAGPLPGEMIDRMRAMYAENFGFGDRAAPCPLKSSTAPDGAVPSGYVAPAAPPRRPLRLERALTAASSLRLPPRIASQERDMPETVPPSSSGCIEPGKAAPAFHLADQRGEKHRLSQYKGQWVVLYFYPKDDTPGCTKEACQFRDASEAVSRSGAVVLGVSPQDVKSKAKFAEKHGLDFPLLADDDAQVCAKYGVWQEKSMYGRKYMGVARTTYLIDPKGKVAQRWDKVKVPGHADAVLAAIEQHKG